MFILMTYIEVNKDMEDLTGNDDDDYVKMNLRIYAD